MYSTYNSIFLNFFGITKIKATELDNTHVKLCRVVSVAPTIIILVSTLWNVQYMHVMYC